MVGLHDTLFQASSSYNLYPLRIELGGLPNVSSQPNKLVERVLVLVDLRNLTIDPLLNNFTLDPLYQGVSVVARKAPTLPKVL